MTQWTPPPGWQGQLEQTGEPVTEAVRRATLDAAVRAEIAKKGRVEYQTENQAGIVFGRRPNHVLHLLLSLVTVGFWIPIWIAVAIMGGEKRVVLMVDDYGKLYRQG